MTVERTTLVFHDVGDPMQRTHGIDRPAHYRLKILLKRMLRDYGFRIDSCRNPLPVDDTDSAGRAVPAAVWGG